MKIFDDSERIDFSFVISYAISLRLGIVPTGRFIVVNDFKKTKSFNQDREDNIMKTWNEINTITLDVIHST